MARQQTYGKNLIGKKPAPRIRVKVHISEIQGTKSLRSKAFTVYGPEYEEVLGRVEQFLRERYDNGQS